MSHGRMLMLQRALKIIPLYASTSLRFGQWRFFNRRIYLAYRVVYRRTSYIKVLADNTHTVRLVGSEMINDIVEHNNEQRGGTYIINNMTRKARYPYVGRPRGERGKTRRQLFSNQVLYPNLLHSKYYYDRDDAADFFILRNWIKTYWLHCNVYTLFLQYQLKKVYKRHLHLHRNLVKTYRLQFRNTLVIRELNLSHIQSGFFHEPSFRVFARHDKNLDFDRLDKMDIHKQAKSIWEYDDEGRCYRKVRAPNFWYSKGRLVLRPKEHFDTMRTNRRRPRREIYDKRTEKKHLAGFFVDDNQAQKRYIVNKTKRFRRKPYKKAKATNKVVKRLHTTKVHKKRKRLVRVVSKRRTGILTFIQYVSRGRRRRPAQIKKRLGFVNKRELNALERRYFKRICRIRIKGDYRDKRPIRSGRPINVIRRFAVRRIQSVHTRPFISYLYKNRGGLERDSRIRPQATKTRLYYVALKYTNYLKKHSKDYFLRKNRIMKRTISSSNQYSILVKKKRMHVRKFTISFGRKRYKLRARRYFRNHKLLKRRLRRVTSFWKRKKFSLIVQGLRRKHKRGRILAYQHKKPRFLSKRQRRKIRNKRRYRYRIKYGWNKKWPWKRKYGWNKKWPWKRKYGWNKKRPWKRKTKTWADKEAKFQRKRHSKFKGHRLQKDAKKARSIKKY